MPKRGWSVENWEELSLGSKNEGYGLPKKIKVLQRNRASRRYIYIYIYIYIFPLKKVYIYCVCIYCVYIYIYISVYILCVYILYIYISSTT